MKTFIINLDRSVERMEYMQRLARGLGLDFERVRAIDGRQLDPAVRKLHQETAEIPPSDGEVGCFLSHRECWRLVADGKDDVVLVLEDDMVSLSADRAVLERASALAQQMDLVRLEGHWAKVWADSGGIPVSSGHRVARLRSGAIGTGAYIVSRNGARKLLEMHPAYRRPIDYALYSNPNDRLDIRIVLPALFAQGYLVGKDGAFASTIEARSKPRRNKSGALMAGIERARRYLSGQRRYAQM